MYILLQDIFTKSTLRNLTAGFLWMSRRAILPVCLTVLLSGCGSGPEIAAVEGAVTLDGQPLADASVVFTPPDGRPAGALTDSNGYYVLNFSQDRKGAMPGLNRVMVTMKRSPFRGPDGQVVPARPESIPMKYNSKTELSFEVVDGEKNVANFDLDSSGPVAQSSEN